MYEGVQVDDDVSDSERLRRTCEELRDEWWRAIGHGAPLAVKLGFDGESNKGQLDALI